MQRYGCSRSGRSTLRFVHERGTSLAIRVIITAVGFQGLSGKSLAGVSLLLRNHSVSPLHKRHENRRVAKLRTIISEIGLGDSPSPGAGAARINRNLSRHNFLQ